MNRRQFSKHTLTALGLATLPAGSVLSTDTACHELKTMVGQTLISECGLNLSLIESNSATTLEDEKQFVLTFKALHPKQTLEEKIYQIKDQTGRSHAVFMSPTDNGTLQAVSNWRTQA